MTPYRNSASDDARKARQVAELTEIRAGLVANASAVAERLFGERPAVIRPSEIRFGDKGGLKVTLRGDAAGLWHHYASDTGGNLLELVMRQTGCDFPAAVSWARDFLGMPRPDFAAPLTDEDRRLMAQRAELNRAKVEQEQREAKAEREARHEEMAEQCRRAWEAAGPAPADHPYLISKSLPPHGLRVDRHGNLMVPMYWRGRIFNLQRIAPDGGARWREMNLVGDGNKMFCAGARVKGTLLVLGDLDPELPVAFAEGWATGWTVLRCAQIPVVICWNVSNKHSVVSEWRRHSPTQMLLDAADNDHGKERNAGIEMADRLCREFGVIPVAPAFSLGEGGSDWNDYERIHGSEAVAAEFRQALSVRGDDF